MIRKAIQSSVCAIALLFAAPAFSADVKVPTTAEEHFALAKQYQEQADVAKKQADEHRAMAEAAKKSIANSHAAAHGQRDPKVAKMEKHCAALATAADKLATDTQKAADYHTFRGKELQGK
jgi:hypothetical protein